ncbi:lipid droplet-associated protein [Mycobacterium sp. SM1]|uniref:lipid droplet-associated protein n=1 Tax=Mycobacterium sp. SM1 TaxID=2816243 RepID=UPI001BCF3828|nr:lipid droplet-associated protein [Mycobacterium sp. SM1]MBS4730664.1 lipid droplet-associated protein [Mycobacterium sp. SM1]
MSTAPYGIRLLVGVATVAVEETMKLPRTILLYPMTLVSQAAHLVMRFQQNLAELVIKGDATLDTLFPPKEEQPEWATFDEDSAQPGDEPSGPGPTAGNDDRRTEGRFALYSVAEGPPASRESATPAGPPARPMPAQQPPGPGPAQTGPAKTAPAPPVATELDYDTLTLAQLRARLHTLDVDELEALLAYEQATKARAPFQTLLANRITRATAK